MAPLVESVNVNLSWQTLKEYLVRTRALVVMAQEIALHSEEEVGEASQWALRHNWLCFIVPSCLGQGGGTSAGVGLFVRDFCGLREPVTGVAKSTCIAEARAVGGIVEIPGMRPTLMISIYLHCNVGLDNNNVAILRSAGQALEDWDGPALGGGDFNLVPEVLRICTEFEFLTPSIFLRSARRPKKTTKQTC